MFGSVVPHCITGRLPARSELPLLSVVVVAKVVLVLVLNAMTVAPASGTPFTLTVPENEVVGGSWL